METWAGRLLWAEGEQICDVVAKLQGLVGPMPRDVAQLTPCALSKAVEFASGWRRPYRYLLAERVAGRYRGSLFRVVDGEAYVVRLLDGGRCVQLEPGRTFSEIMAGSSELQGEFLRLLLEPHGARRCLCFSAFLLGRKTPPRPTATEMLRHTFLADTAEIPRAWGNRWGQPVQ